MNIGIISLGCPKNLTDTEVMLGKLASAGHNITSNEKNSDVLIINTCAFIQPAIDEAESEINRAIKLKKNGIIKHIIVAGCLPQRKEKFNPKKMKAVDAFVGAGEIDKIVEFVNNLHLSPLVSHLTPSSCLFDWKTPRIKATPKHYAYIKIADGCDNNCAYCAVPKIRGKFKSRPIDDIVKEAKLLAKSGTKEIILIAQDTTYYGKDIYGKFMLAELLVKLTKIRGVKWIRIMYAHPEHFTDKLIKTISSHKKICNYIDLPVQHICDRILRQMGRMGSRQKITCLITKIRRSMPGIALRTSLIVGFPGEKDKHFKELLEFIKAVRFERLGIFTYSPESGTSAAKMRGQIPEKIKVSRFHQAMRLQNRISKELNKGKIGKVIEVLIENRIKNNYIGRSFADAPEIDGSVIISLPTCFARREGRNNIKIGEIVKAKIKRANAYDLFGSLVT